MSARYSNRRRLAPGLSWSLLPSVLPLPLLTLSLLLAACSSGSSDLPNAESGEPGVGSSVDGDSGSTDSPGAVDARDVDADDRDAGGLDASSGDTEDVEAAPLVLDVPSGEATIELLTAARGGGKHPLLEWSELADAIYYGVYLYAPSGEPYWFWRGEATSVYVGGAIQLDDNAMGVAVTADLTWGVIGYSDDGAVLGVSSRLPLAP